MSGERRLSDTGREVGDLSSEPQDLAALMVETRAAYQASLVETATTRKQLEADIKAAGHTAERDSLRFQPDTALLKRFSEAWFRYGATGLDHVEPPHPPADLREAEAIWTTCAHRCAEAIQRYRVERSEWEIRKAKLFRKTPTEPRLPETFQGDLYALRQVQENYQSLRSAYVRAVELEAVPKLKAQFESETSARGQRLTQLLDSNIASIQIGVDLLGSSGQSWEVAFDGPANLATSPRAATRLGSIGSGLPQPYAFEVPLVVNFPGSRGLAIEAPLSTREQALELLRSVVLRVLKDVPPGQLHLCLIDPTAMGQTFAEFLHLGDYEERLIDSYVKTSGQAIERCLDEQVAHLETVISKYLRGQFQNIHDYNRHAGAMTEPYKLIVIADYPRQFSERASEELLSLVENGPRCGVHTLLMYSPDTEEPRGQSLGRLVQSMDLVMWQGTEARVRIGKDGPNVAFRSDRCPSIAFDADGRPTTPAAEFLEALGRAAKTGTDAVVNLENFLPVVNRNRAGVLPDFRAEAPPITQAPETWWQAGSAEMAVAPIGRSGAQGVASLFFSSTIVAGGAIMVGLPRSGKTTSLHAMILTMSMLYSPEELELYLIDAKHGVEFKVYEQLPHARMVSVHSEREFSLAVLKSIEAKIRERAELIKVQGSGLSNITEYRAATGKNLPRIVVIVDEFHELFEEADAIGLEAFAAFSNIVRMGPFSGVHIVVASQTLSSMPAMDRQTLILLPQRVAFMCNEYDAEIVMGESNKATRLLSKTGEGLFNPSRGDESKNQPFQGLYVPPDQRGLLLRELREKADAAGWTRRPRVFDGDAVVARPALGDVLKPSNRFTVPIGEPFTLADSEAIALPRTRGANVLLVGDRNDDSATDLGLRGVLHSFLVAAQAQRTAVTVVDFIGDEQVTGGLTIMDVAEAAGARYVRSGSLNDVLGDLAAAVTSRTTAEDYKAPTQLLVLFGLQRALSLTPFDPYSSTESDQPSPSPSQYLATILAGGPEVGIHVVIDVDRTRSVELHLGTEALAELTLRVAGSGADQKDLGLVTGSYGDVPPLRLGQLLIGDLLKGTARRARGYAILTTPPGTHNTETDDD